MDPGAFVYTNACVLMLTFLRLISIVPMMSELYLVVC